MVFLGSLVVLYCLILIYFPYLTFLYPPLCPHTLLDNNNLQKKQFDIMSNSHQTHLVVHDQHFDQQQHHHSYQGRPIARSSTSSHRPTSTTHPSFPSPALSFSPSSFSSSSFSSSFTSSLPSPPFPSSLPSFNYSTAYPFPPFSSSSSSSSSSPPSPSPSDEAEHHSCHSESSSPSSTTTTTLEPTQPPMNLPLIGNGPGYKNGEAIALPILPTFNKKLASGRNSVPASPTTTDAHGSSSRPLLGEAALIPSSLHPNDIQHPGVISTAGTTTASSTVTNGGLHTPATATSTCSGVAGPDNVRGGADAGILVFSGGTACNSLVQLLQDMTPNVTYVCKFSSLLFSVLSVLPCHLYSLSTLALSFPFSLLFRIFVIF